MGRFSRSRGAPLIVLLTDFGFKDSYVGVMKGVIRGLCREVEIIDLSHNITPHDVTEAAFVLAASWRYFPQQTVFTCVVDPGVGTDRDVLCMRSGGQTFLAPDNGLLSVIAEQSGRDDMRKVTEHRYFLKERSATFHGRDIFAPVAAHLAGGLEPQKLGPAVKHIRRLELPKPVRAADGSLRGEIIYIDQFGNLITNILRPTMQGSLDVPPASIEVRLKRRRIRGVSEAYGAAGKNELLALIGSSGYLEVAVNRGSAAQLLGCAKGDRVTLKASDPPAVTDGPNSRAPAPNSTPPPVSR